MTQSTLLDLFGTLEPPPERQLLTAGGLSAVLEAGNLRTIRYQGVEVLRAISLLARDTGWGTYAPEIGDLSVLTEDSVFQVTYIARCTGPQGTCTYRMTITGSAAGRLSMQAVLQTEAAFPTNRTGFVLLHPAEVAGKALTVEDATAARRTIRFPDAIDPGTPATGITAMEHAPTPGMLARLEMTGYLFEIEDQRNWADASFKTYVRPLAKPRPYVIPTGTTETQSVALHITAATPAPAPRPDAGLPVLTIGAPLDVVPDLPLFADRAQALSGDPGRIGPGIAQRLILRWRPGDSLAPGQRLASALAARCTVEAILPSRDPRAKLRSLWMRWPKWPATPFFLRPNASFAPVPRERSRRARLRSMRWSWRFTTRGLAGASSRERHPSSPSSTATRRGLPPTLSISAAAASSMPPTMSL